MNFDDPFIKRLLASIEQLPHNVYDFTKIEALDASLFTEKAVLLIFKLKDSGEKRSRWIPFSQLKKDKNNNIWLANWLLERIKIDGRNE